MSSDACIVRWLRSLPCTDHDKLGKTTAQLQLIERLLKQGFSARRLLGVQFDDLESFLEIREPILRIVEWYEAEVLGTTLNAAAKSGQPAILLFDEVQNVSTWATELKHLVDTSKVHVFVAGSSAIRIEKAKDSLAGRLHSINVGTLTGEERGDGWREVLTYLKAAPGNRRLRGAARATSWRADPGRPHSDSPAIGSLLEDHVERVVGTVPREVVDHLIVSKRFASCDDSANTCGITTTTDRTCRLTATRQHDLLRAVAGVSQRGAGDDWVVNAKKVVEILVAGIRARTAATPPADGEREASADTVFPRDGPTRGAGRSIMQACRQNRRP
jgi:hypothetical protein